MIDRSDGDGLLLARLRGLLRRHRNTQELQVHAGIARAPGLAEAPGTFHGRGRIAVVATGQDRAMALRAGLKPHCRHRITTLGTGDLLGAVATTPRTDVFLVSLAGPETDDGPRMVAELRAASAARHGRIVVALPIGAEASAGVLLDTGADDVVTGGPEPRELALRLCNQLRQKRAADGLRARLRDDLQAAVRDPLTGLHNRRYALPCLDRMIDTARADRPLVVMVADLDHFKRVNDTMGHAAGDHVLRRVGALLRENLRDRDLVARIGGEEFLIAIPDCDPEKARRTAGRLCRIIRRSPVQVAGSTEPVAITISIGVALARPGPDEARPEVEALMEQADRALYSAKAGGRNTVTLATRTAA